MVPSRADTSTRSNDVLTSEGAVKSGMPVGVGVGVGVEVGANWGADVNSAGAAVSSETSRPGEHPLASATTSDKARTTRGELMTFLMPTFPCVVQTRSGFCPNTVRDLSLIRREHPKMPAGEGSPGWLCPTSPKLMSPPAKSGELVQPLSATSRASDPALHP